MPNSFIVLAARVLLAALFIAAGFGKLADPSGTAGYLASLGIPLAGLSTWIVLLVEILGGLAILTGFFTRPAAYVLALFCIATGFIAHFHPADQMQIVSFMKNLAIAGGFLVLAVHGPGSISVDARRAA